MPDPSAESVYPMSVKTAIRRATRTADEYCDEIHGTSPAAYAQCDRCSRLALDLNRIAEAARHEASSEAAAN